MKNYIGHISCVVVTTFVFLTFLLVQDMKHTSEKIILQEEYISMLSINQELRKKHVDVLDTNHRLFNQLKEAIGEIGRRGAVIEDLVKKIKLLMIEEYGTGGWAENEKKISFAER
tara:strand:+ start:590 stop:934 length:345 start_codon:yes stop_codon:yes gene_type:complete